MHSSVNLDFESTASPPWVSLIEEAQKDNTENICEIIVLSPPPLTTVVTGRELGRPQRILAIAPVFKQHLRRSCKKRRECFLLFSIAEKRKYSQLSNAKYAQFHESETSDMNNCCKCF